MINLTLKHTEEERVEKIKRGNVEIKKSTKVKKHEFISKKGDNKKGIWAILIVGIIVFFISVTSWLICKDKITLEKAKLSTDPISIEYSLTKE